MDPVFGINSGVGAIRRSVDQRIYLGMFTEIATGVARSSFDRNLGVSQTTALVQLSREYIQFLQYRVPEIVEQVIAIGGALIGMAFFDMRIASACLIVLAPLVAINSLYSRRVVALHGEVHDSAEEAFEVIAAKDPERVRAYYAAMAVPQQKIANWGAFSFSLMRLVLLGIFLVVLYNAIDLDDFTTGNIYTIVAYIWTFVTSSEWWPRFVEFQSGVSAAGGFGQWQAERARERMLATAGVGHWAWRGGSEAPAGDVVWDARTRRGFLRLNGFVPNDPERAPYQLWIFDAARDDRYPVDGGVFDVPPGRDEIIVPMHPTLPVSRPVAFAVTVERPGGVVVSAREKVVAFAQAGS